MIRHAIRYITAPLLGLLAPEILDSIRGAELNEALATGERNEARRNADQESFANVQLNAQADRDAQTICDMTKRIEQLEEIERNGLADDEVYARSREEHEEAKRERDELRGQVESMTLHNARFAAGASAAVAEINALRVRIRELETQLDAAADKDPPAAASLVEPCAWCLGPSDEGMFADGGETMALCVDHYENSFPEVSDIRARVATRAASCESRRDSADPHAKACETCGAFVGRTCAEQRSLFDAS